MYPENPKRTGAFVFHTRGIWYAQHRIGDQTRVQSHFWIARTFHSWNTDVCVHTNTNSLYNQHSHSHAYYECIDSPNCWNFPDEVFVKYFMVLQGSLDLVNDIHSTLSFLTLSHYYLLSLSPLSHSPDPADQTTLTMAWMDFPLLPEESLQVVDQLSFQHFLVSLCLFKDFVACWTCEPHI